MSEPRVLHREDAAKYCGLTIAKFDSHVRAGTLPGRLPFGIPHVWDRLALDRALDQLSGLTPANDAENPALRAFHERKGALRHGKAKPR